MVDITDLWHERENWSTVISLWESNSRNSYVEVLVMQGKKDGVACVHVQYYDGGQ